MFAAALLELSESARTTAGIALLTVSGIASGGSFLLKVGGRCGAATDFQKSFFHAGHAHAGVFVILGLICVVLSEATTLDGLWLWLARSGALIAAILMPAGFFFSAMGSGRESPNRWFVLIPAGAAFLTAGTITLGIGLL